MILIFGWQSSWERHSHSVAAKGERGSVSHERTHERSVSQFVREKDSLSFSHTHKHQQVGNMPRGPHVWWSSWFLDYGVFDIRMIEFVTNAPSLAHTHTTAGLQFVTRDTWWSCWYLDDRVFDVCMIKFVINTPSHTHTHTTAGLAICSEGHMPGRNLPNSIYS